MSTLYLTLTIIFIVVAVAMILIILVQRPAGGGLAGAFGGAGGGGTEGVFGGRVGDALTVMTVVAFTVYLTLALVLNANIWMHTSASTAPPTVAETLLPMSAGEPGFGNEPSTTEEANPTDAGITAPPPELPAPAPPPELPAPAPPPELPASPAPPAPPEPPAPTPPQPTPSTPEPGAGS
ncbi:MAG: preprotein translocase subunit SecG [Phycisphaerales bacterium]|nr:preprotein translocase subunit SecG [Phycisphaerales bacterium]HJN79892.1 preprotein translocase subunit SecG [Phycisphaerales bacterium]